MVKGIIKHLGKNKFKYIILAALLIAVLLFVKLVLIDIVYVNKQYENNRIITPWGEKIKSGNLSVDYSIEQTLSDIKSLGLNTVNVPVQIDIPTLNSSEATLDNASKAKAIKLIKKLRYRGINVILEPYPYIKNGELYETQMNPDNKSLWFKNWKEEVLKPLIEDIAKPYKVYALCIGSNFDKFENEYNNWSDVADFVKAIFKGRITYKTNWWYTAEWDIKNEYSTYSTKLNNPVFQKVDFISVAAYFELSDKDKNTAENLKEYIYKTPLFNRHQNIYQELKDLSNKWSKPVFFGELGFPKFDKATTHPWNPKPSDIPNDEEQTNGFQAYKQVFEKESWNLGFSIFAIGKIDELKNYYPSKESIKVINGWYKQQK